MKSHMKVCWPMVKTRHVITRHRLFNSICKGVHLLWRLCSRTGYVPWKIDTQSLFHGSIRIDSRRNCRRVAILGLSASSIMQPLERTGWFLPDKIKVWTGGEIVPLAVSRTVILKGDFATILQNGKDVFVRIEVLCPKDTFLWIEPTAWPEKTALRETRKKTKRRRKEPWPEELQFVWT